MKKLKHHLLSEPGIYFQVFLWNILIFGLQFIGSKLSGSLSEHADAMHILADQIVFFIMISVGLLSLNYPSKESIVRVSGGLLGSALFFFVGFEVIAHTFEELAGGQHSVIGPYMLLFTGLAFAINWLQYHLLTTAQSATNLTSFDLQGHVKIDMFKNGALVSIAIINSVYDLAYADIVLGLIIGLWLIWRGVLVLKRTHDLFKTTKTA